MTASEQVSGAPGPGAPDEQTRSDPVGSAPQGASRRSGSALLRGGGWNAGAQLAPVAVNLALTPFVIHGLGVARFGLYVLATSLADFLGTFDGGIYASSQRYFAVYVGTDDRRSTSRLCISLILGVTLLGTAMVGVLFLAAPLLLALFHIPMELRAEGQFLLRVLGLVVALELMRGVFVAILNARQRFAMSSLTIVGQYAVYTVGVVLTVQQHYGLRGIAVTLLVQTAVTTAVLAVPTRHYLLAGELRLLPRRELSEFIRYASKAQVAGLSDLINLQSDSMLIGGFLSVRSVTYYSSGRNFAAQMRALPWNAIAPAAAMLGRTYGEAGEDAALEQFRHLQRLWVRACTAWIAVAAAAAYFGVTRWLGVGFELSGTVAVVLLVGYLFRLWAGMLTVYCQTIGHPELEARYGVVSVLVNLAFTFALVVPFGVVGVVAATAAGQLVGSLYLLRTVRTRLSRTVPSFLSEVPWAAAVVAAVVTAGLELAALPVLTLGPLGLIEAGLVAVPGLLVFVLVLLGPRQAWVQLGVQRGRLRAWRSQRA